MLVNLSVRNFALVSELSISFHAGLTVITGESGAGKSILLNALGLVLGARASKLQVRPGSKQCEVTAEFDVSSLLKTQKYLKDNALEDASNPEICVIRRIAGTDGRSRAWINGIPVNLDTLRILAQPLVAVHGQFTQQQLLDPSTQLTWFDDFLHDPQLIETVEDLFTLWQNTEKAYLSLKESVRRDNDRRDLLKYQVSELESVRLEENEFERSTAIFKDLSILEHNLTEVAKLGSSLDDEILPLINQIEAALLQMQDSINALDTTKEFVETARINLEEAQASLSSYARNLQSQEFNLDEVSARLDEIHDLARKHRVHPKDLKKHQDILSKELDDLHTNEAEVRVLEERFIEAKKAFLDVAGVLSKKRKQNVLTFCDAVVKTLNELDMPNVDFRIDFSQVEHPRGLDQIEFLVSPNTKYPLAPLRETASGGEIARISLAILMIVSKASNLPCLILDEADVGVGGTTADTLGRLLRNLGKESQIVCVTHAPQVAALGKQHLRVSKSSTQDVEIVNLAGPIRVEEIARMVGGKEINRESRDYAQTLLNEAS